MARTEARHADRGHLCGTSNRGRRCFEGEIVRGAFLRKLLSLQVISAIYVKDRGYCGLRWSS